MSRHPIDAFSLLSGLVVTATAAAALTRPWRFDVSPWVTPTVLVLAGVVVLGLALVGGRRDADGTPVGPGGAADAVGPTPDLEPTGDADVGEPGDRSGQGTNR